MTPPKLPLSYGSGYWIGYLGTSLHAIAKARTLKQAKREASDTLEALVENNRECIPDELAQKWANKKGEQ